MDVASGCTLSAKECIERRAGVVPIVPLNVIEITHWVEWPNGARNWHPRAIYATRIPRYSQRDHEYV
jgi:hypothetical protein